MKTYFILFLIVIILQSCDKSITEIRIILKNESKHSLDIELYPKKEYLNGENYRFSKIGSGSQPCTFTLETYTTKEPVIKVLFTSNDLNLSATDLAQQVFDSIRVVLKSEPSTILLFTHEQARAYSKNLFTDASSWSYELNSIYEPVGIKRTTFHANDYTFSFRDEFFELP